MENEEVIETKQGNYLTGTLGAILGGAVAAIPWVLAYVYGGMMLSILAALIAAGEFYGYKICKGRIDRKLPIIIMILAIIIVTIVTLLIIPALLIQKEGLHVSITNIQYLYTNSEFSTALMKDFVISIVFTILGASIITVNIKKQLENGKGQDMKLDINNTEELVKAKKDAIDLIKPIFTKYGATTKEKAMMKEEVLAEIENEKASQSFNSLKQYGIIKKYKGKFYYSEENENKQINPKKTSLLLVLGIMVVVIAILIIISVIFENVEKSNSKEKYNNTEVEFEISKDWNNYEADYDTEWNFYKYINTFPAIDSSENEAEEETTDYSSYPAAINVYYDKINKDEVTSVEDIKSNIEKSVESKADKPDVFDTNISKTLKNYDMLKIKILYNSAPEEVIYYYYILDGENLSCITLHSFSLADDKEMEKEGNELANSFNWIK